MPHLKCGFAQRDITPVPGTVFLDGYGFRLTPAEGVRDRLYVEVCAFECGDERYALLSLDICGMSAAVYDYVAGHIEGFTGMRRERFALACTHTHSGPACGTLAGLPINRDWLASVAEKAADAMVEAFEAATPGRFHLSICGELKHSFNRRGRQPIDRRIRGAVFVGEEGAVRGIIASAACHPVINTTQYISADYPSVLTAEAERRYPGVPALFICGRGGDINPHDPDGLGPEQLILTLGHELADGVLDFADAVAGRRGDAAETELRCDYRKITVPMKPFAATEDYRREIKRLVTAYRSEKEPMAKHYILRELDHSRAMLDKLLAGESPDLVVPLQVLILDGVAAFVMLPFEVLTLTGNKIEEILCSMGFAPEAIYVCGCSNSVCGYLAPPEEFEFGGYEVSGVAHWYGLPECSEKSEPAVLENAKNMAAELAESRK